MKREEWSKGVVSMTIGTYLKFDWCMFGRVNCSVGLWTGIETDPVRYVGLVHILPGH